MRPAPFSTDVQSHPTTRRQALLAAGGALMTAAYTAGCSKGSIRDSRTAADGLFSNVHDQSAGVLPIGASERAARRTRLQSILASQGVGALIVEGGATMTYLTGVAWWRSERLFALVVPADGAHFWLCPAFEEQRALSLLEAPDGPAGDLVLWQEHEYPYEPLASALAARKIERLMIDPQLRWIFADRIGERLGRERLISGQPAVSLLRAKKDAHEVALLKRACELTQFAIVETAKTLSAGVTAGEIAARVDRVHELLGMKSPWSVCLIGPAAAEPHGKSRDVRLARGDVLLMDVGASLHGYQSDVTRTFVFDGTPSLEVTRVWNAVRDAQKRAFERVRPRVSCRSVDAEARATIARLGFGRDYEHFTHRLGHGIGLETHEDPYFDGGSETLLEEGMTLTDEPGVYLRGRFGVRIEDMLLVIRDGADHFGQWQASPRGPA